MFNFVLNILLNIRKIIYIVVKLCTYNLLEL